MNPDGFIFRSSYVTSDAQKAAQKQRKNDIHENKFLGRFLWEMNVSTSPFQKNI
jgi:hypothetical protein